MAILPYTITPNWSITLSRELLEGERALATSDFVIVGNAVTAIHGTGLTRQITLQTPTATLTPQMLTLHGDYAGVLAIVSTTPEIPMETVPYLMQIRDLLRIGLTENDLSNAQIASDAFLGKAEQEVRAALQNPMEYETRAATDIAYRTRVRTSVMYRTAALLVPALPRLLQDATLDTRVVYEDQDWQERIAYFVNLANDALGPDMGPVMEGGVVIATLATRRTYF